MDDLKTERSFSSQATWVIDVLGLFFDMLSMGVFKENRLWQTSGRLVQELNVCTVVLISKRHIKMKFILLFKLV